MRLHLGKINSYRRSLQRAHLRKMVGMVLRDSGVPEDAQTLARQGLVTLRSQLQSAVSKPGIKMNVETCAHLSESVARIDEAPQGQHATHGLLSRKPARREGAAAAWADPRQA